MKIIGAGLTGMIAAYAFPRAQILEASPEPPTEHKALLRFRSEAVSTLTGVPFKKVLVRKGIFIDGEFRQPDIRLCNMYSDKVLGLIDGDRSIWNVEPVERWIAPENFISILREDLASRILYGMVVSDFYDDQESWISTMPLLNTLNCVHESHLESEADVLSRAKLDLEFRRSPIEVRRYRLANVNAYQTIYFPSPTTCVYRASITGDLLIVEASRPFPDDNPFGYSNWQEEVAAAFGIAKAQLSAYLQLDSISQEYGKIVECEDDALREHAIGELSDRFEVYSLGRFATWRNILLDDVVHDIQQIKRLMIQPPYKRRLGK